MRVSVAVAHDRPTDQATETLPTSNSKIERRHMHLKYLVPTIMQGIDRAN
jgi:hypothetical protein